MKYEGGILMFCNNCGKELKETSQFCPYCGKHVSVQQSESNSVKLEDDIVNQRKPVLKRKWFLGAAAVILLFIVGSILLGSNNSATIEKLSEFTYVEKLDDQCNFTFGDFWRLVYTEENAFVEFNDPDILDYLAYALGTYDLENTGEFSYDLDENEARIYLNCESQDGTLTIINYNLEDSEVTLMIDGEQWEPTDEFENLLYTSGLLDTIREDVDALEYTLNQYDLELEDIADISYRKVEKSI